MLAKSNLLKCVVIFVLLMCVGVVGERRNRRKVGGNRANKITHDRKGAINETGRGLFFRGGLLSFSKVLNFFPVGGERECVPAGQLVARAGICLNAYDCRQRDGRAAGDCAHGLGVCCVFETSCGGVVQNNLTYFVSPGFPELWTGEEDCNITIEKSYAGIMQLRIDFIHFTIGQPNRTTGECNEDAMILGDGETKFILCGQNHGQHIYYTLSSNSESREAGDLPSSKATSLSMRMRGGDMPRLWLMRLAQLPLAESAPHGCLQYYTTDNGTIKTFNYASNGRHLAGQEYKACIRRSAKHCAVRYMPCDARSFRISTGEEEPDVIQPTVDPGLRPGPGAAGGPGTGFDGPDGSFVTPTASTEAGLVDQVPAETVNDPEELMPVQSTPAPDDEIEGSGDDPQIEATNTENTGVFSRNPVASLTVNRQVWSYISSWLWGQSPGARALRWSPYAQHFSDEDRIRYFGYGNFGAGLTGFGRQRCQDRITIPCESEYFVSSGYSNVGVCDPHHCGGSFCGLQQGTQCRVETSVTPFAVSVHFGPPTVKKNPEDNIGACLKYTQLPCDS